ncbi:MAG: 8-amino-7-oxononanoate synthase [Verrucomicrobiales bacterium]|nr:8-amino-7-oxononanoate synthase [Verrucomicrobiales bacterium]
MRDPQQDLDDLTAAGLRRELRTLSGPQRPQIQLGDEALLNFSSNDYLGLANEEALKITFQKAVAKHGVGAGSSRLISGTMTAHMILEETIATLKNAPAALTFSSGYAAATGSIPAIVGKDDYIILDKLCHASLIDGSRLSGATMRVFPHNDLQKLSDHLHWADRKKTPDSRVLVITESVFSMDGDLAPLREICGLTQRHGALLLVDEAHAFGIIGPRGRGLAAQLGMEQQIDFQMGTFSKAVGLTGGYLCAGRAWIDLLLNRARSFIYSTAPAPALAETITASLNLIAGERGDDLRSKLRENINILDPQANSAIIPVVIGANEAALAASQKLRENGFLVPAIRYPTVPRGTARLRITLSAPHREEDITALQDQLVLLKRNIDS